MTDVIFLVAVTAALLWYALDWYESRREQRVALGRLVVVNLTTGESLDGRLRAWQGDLAVLEAVTLITPDGQRHRMDGDALVPRPRVSFMQVYGT